MAENPFPVKRSGQIRPLPLEGAARGTPHLRKKNDIRSPPCEFGSGKRKPAAESIDFDEFMPIRGVTGVDQRGPNVAGYHIGLDQLTPLRRSTTHGHIGALGIGGSSNLSCAIHRAPVGRPAAHSRRGGAITVRNGVSGANSVLSCRILLRCSFVRTELAGDESRIINEVSVFLPEVICCAPVGIGWPFFQHDANSFDAV